MSNGNRQLMIAEKAYCLRVVYFDCERSALNQPPIQTIRFRSPDSGALNQSSLNIQRIFRMHNAFDTIDPGNTTSKYGQIHFVHSQDRMGTRHNGRPLCWPTNGSHFAEMQMIRIQQRESGEVTRQE